MTSPAKKLKIELPDSERGRSPDDLRRFDKLQRKLNRRDLSDQQRNDILRELDEIERAPQVRAEAEWRKQAEVETAALAEARGETLGAEGATVKRLLERDPLLSLVRAGKITPLQFDVGVEVRDLYDRRAEDIASVEFNGMPAGQHDHERFVGNRFLRAKACEMIGRIERAVAVRCKAEPAALAMLRAICERGMSLTSQGRGRAYDRNAAALAQALDVADDVLRRRI